MAAAVAAAVSELPRPAGPDVGAVAVIVVVAEELDEEEADDDDDDEEVEEPLAVDGIRKPLTDSGFRLVLLLAAAAIILLLLLLLLLLALTDELEEVSGAAPATAAFWRFPCPTGTTAATLA